MNNFGNVKSNLFWGRRSGSVYKDGTNAFVQRQFGTGPSGNRKPRKTELKNVPNKWFR